MVTMSPAAGRKIVSPRMDKSARPPVEIFRNEFVEILKDAEVCLPLGARLRLRLRLRLRPRLRLRLRLRRLCRSGVSGVGTW